jgi:hypothetical protein
MLKGKLIVALVVALLGGFAQADDQSDAEVKAKSEAGRVRTFSYIDTKLEAEFVYDVDAETAKKLPKGDIKKLPAKEANALEDTIAAIRKQEPKKVVDLHGSKEAATTATHGCYWYHRPVHYHRPWVRPVPYWNNAWYPGNYYRGGGFYHTHAHVTTINTVWPYYGSYCPPVYPQPVYYWGC